MSQNECRPPQKFSWQSFCFANRADICQNSLALPLELASENVAHSLNILNVCKLPFEAVNWENIQLEQMIETDSPSPSSRSRPPITPRIGALNPGRHVSASGKRCGEGEIWQDSPKAKTSGSPASSNPSSTTGLMCHFRPATYQSSKFPILKAQQINTASQDCFEN